MSGTFHGPLPSLRRRSRGTHVNVQAKLVLRPSLSGHFAACGNQGPRRGRPAPRGSYSPEKPPQAVPASHQVPSCRRCLWFGTARSEAYPASPPQRGGGAPNSAWGGPLSPPNTSHMDAAEAWQAAVGRLSLRNDARKMLGHVKNPPSSPEVFRVLKMNPQHPPVWENGLF